MRTTIALTATDGDEISLETKVAAESLMRARGAEWQFMQRFLAHLRRRCAGDTAALGYLAQMERYWSFESAHDDYVAMKSLAEIDDIASGISRRMAKQEKAAHEYQSQAA